MIVFRIEVERKQGPFTSGPFTADCYWSADPAIVRACSVYRRSVINPVDKEPRRGIPHSYVYGCKSATQLLQEWIPCKMVYQELLKAGFMVNKYEVPDDKVILMEPYQLAFHWADAKLLGSVNPYQEHIKEIQK